MQVNVGKKTFQQLFQGTDQALIPYSVALLKLLI